MPEPGNPSQETDEQTTVKVAKVVCGGNSTGLLTEDGDIYTWGYNKYGQCGIGLTVGAKNDKVYTCKNGEGVVLPTRSPLPKGHKAKDLSMGFSHTMAVTASGELWACGSNQNGQLGTGTPSGNESNCCVNWTLVQLNKPVETIACGGQHTIALTTDSKVYSWGRMDKGRTGQPKPRRDIPLPLPMNSLKGEEPIRKIYTRDGHSFAIDSGKRVWAWGPNKYGQLGFIGETERSLNWNETPRRLEQLRGVDEIYLAGSSTAGFSFFLISGLTYILNQHIRDLNEFQVDRVLSSCRTPDLVNTEDSQRTPLHWAAYMGAFGIMRRLLQHVSMPSFIDSITTDLQGWTALHFCAYWGFVECARLLLRRGAQTQPVDAEGQTPAHLAVARGHLEIAVEIIKMEEQTASPVSLLITDKAGRTLLDLCTVDDAFLMKRETTQYYDITMLFTPEQAALGEQLADFLRDKRVHCWSPSHSRAGNTLEDAISRSRGVIFFVGESTVAPGSVQRDMLSQATSAGLSIFPIWEQRIDLEPDVESIVFRYQLVDFSDTSQFLLNGNILSSAIKSFLNLSSYGNRNKGATANDEDGILPMDRDTLDTPLVDAHWDQPFHEQTVFLSYDNSDMETAQAIVQSFQNRGEINVFDGGACKDKSLLSQAAKGCFAVLVLLSRAAVTSSRIREQVSVAENNKKPLFALQVTTEEINVPLDLRYALAITPLFTFSPQYPDLTIKQIVQTFRLKYHCDRKAGDYQELLGKFQNQTLAQGSTTFTW